MANCAVTFSPLERSVTVESGTTLLDAAGKAHITIDSICGGDGICGRCKMIVRDGSVGGTPTALLTRDEVRQGIVLACQTTVESDLHVEIPEQTRAKEKIVIDKDAQRFRAVTSGLKRREFERSPIADKLLLRLDPPTLDNNIDDCQRIETWIGKVTGIASMQTGLKIIRRIPDILRDNDFAVTALIGRRQGVVEVIDVEGGDTSQQNFLAVVDIGTSTIVAHLADAVTMETVGAEACFNSQGNYGAEVTARIIAAEKRGPEALQRVLVEDINRLIANIAAAQKVNLKDITAVVCAGNTAMMHFLLGIPTRNIRRSPYIATTIEPPPIRAAEVGVKINSRGLLFAVPGVGGWVGGDLTAGILATGLYEADEVTMLIDMGTNGEIILGNKDWMMACSASAGPALEGAGIESGMMAQSGAIEKVIDDGEGVRCEVIGDTAADGICGSGVIDAIAVLLKRGVIDRSGTFVPGSDPRVVGQGESLRYLLADESESLKGREVSLYQTDIENVITAKAAIFAAAQIMLQRVDMAFSDLDRLLIAGGFGAYINLENAVTIGLLPELPPDRMFYVGNTSIWGAKLAAFSHEARNVLRDIVRRTTYFELVGVEDYVDRFQQARFLPHTDIELFPSAAEAN